MHLISLRNLRAYLLALCLLLKAFSACANQSDLTPQKPVVPSMDLITQRFFHMQPFINGLTRNAVRQEIHFFWCMGRTYGQNNYGQENGISIGGSKYGKKFTSYVQAFLTHTPDHIHVYFVHDDVTYNANKKELDALHPDRFHLLHITNVIQNLQASFEQERDFLEVIFGNACAGNPAIASDVYRLIGMPFSHAPHENVPRTSTHYTYCDEDTFIESMEKPFYKQFMHNLFKPESHFSLNVRSFFYRALQVYTHTDNNDLVSLRFSHENVYHKWCMQEVLKKQRRSHYFELFNKFPYMHHLIRSFEDAPLDAKSFEEKLKKPCLKQDTFDIVRLTGPDFLTGIPAVYPSIPNKGPTCAMEWAVGCLLEKCKQPLSPADLFLTNFVYEDDEAWKFLKMCKSFNRALVMALYAKPFGKSHPFNVFITSYLQKTYPYQERGMLVSILKKARANTQCHSNTFEWLSRIRDCIVQSPFYIEYVSDLTHNHAILMLLEDLDITVENPIRTQDFMSEDEKKAYPSFLEEKA